MSESPQRHGILFCFVGPAGSGKTTLAGMVLDKVKGLARSISVTSRPPRSNEQSGVCYHFVSREEFEKKISSGEFFEYEETHNNYYGTPRDPLASAIRSGNDILLIVDIRGALNFKKYFPQNTVVVFIVPPSPEDLQSRLRQRGDANSKDIQQRLDTANREYNQFLEVANSGAVDFLVINEDLDTALRELIEIIDTERKRVKRFQESGLRNLCRL